MVIIEVIVNVVAIVRATVARGADVVGVICHVGSDRERRVLYGRCVAVGLEGPEGVEADMLLYCGPGLDIV